MTGKSFLAGAIAVAAMLAVDMSSIGPNLFVPVARAVIGRPLTPMSYAGVARRTTRRTYRRTAPYYGSPVAPRPGCYQQVDPYGSIYYRCP